MGPTHALGGAAALAGVAVISGHADLIAPWAYGLAAISALVPDADNGTGSLLNRSYFLPVKMITMPLWFNAAHRGRTHSLIGTGIYLGLVIFWFGLLAIFAALVNTAFPLDWPLILGASLVGYASHIVLDMLNIPGVRLLWPLPISIFFPPWRAHGFIPGRFNANSLWAEIFVSIPLIMFLSWFTISHMPAIVTAIGNDHMPAALGALLGASFGALVGLFHGLVGLFRSLGG